MNQEFRLQIDTDRGIDVGVAVGDNGIADILETSPDSGILKYPTKNTDGDADLDFVDLTSSGPASSYMLLVKII